MLPVECLLRDEGPAAPAWPRDATSGRMTDGGEG
jgi:hypothetical protein